MPMNVIIISIIVIVVLVVIIAFFAGGFSGLSNKLRDLVGGATTGATLDAANQDCLNFCDTASSLPTSVQANSAYCKTTLTVDTDGNANTPPRKVRCAGGASQLDVSPQEERRGITPEAGWRVPCVEVSCPL